MTSFTQLTKILRGSPAGRRHLPFAPMTILGIFTLMVSGAIACPLNFLDPVNYQLVNTNADGLFSVSMWTCCLQITGGNTGSGTAGTTDILFYPHFIGPLTFSWSYSSLDDPGFDNAGYLIDGNYTKLTETDGESGTVTEALVAGQTFGFRVATVDNTTEPGVLTICDLVASTDGSAAVPEPGTFGLAMGVMTILAGIRFRRRNVSPFWRMGMGRRLLTILICAGAVAGALRAQGQISYSGVDITGQLKFTQAVNLTQQANLRTIGVQTGGVPETPPKIPAKQWHPPVQQRVGTQGITVAAGAPIPPMSSIPVTMTTSAFHFNGITQVQQRAAFNGNQFSIEPPNPSVAVANGYVLEGVNNAVQVFDYSGNPLLAAPVASNQLFGVGPAVIWGPPKIYGVFPTDMRVFYDQGVNRWFVLQQAQDEDTQGNLLDSSHYYLAVSQTGDPTGTYNVYLMDTTDPDNFFGCPCVADFPQVGSDEYGFYISGNEYNSGFPFFIDATILAINKKALATGALAPTTVRFIVPMGSGYEFAIQPSYTPPGASNYVVSGGVEYFVSSQGSFSSDSNLAVWAMSNTSSLLATPNLKLVETFAPVLPYSYPRFANQAPGPLPYGDSVSPGGAKLSVLDGGDSRIQSVTYSGGRLYTTFATGVTDENGFPLMGGAYVIFSPNFRSGVLSAPVLRQGYIMIKGQHILRPALAVNPQGKGAITFTISGSTLWPSAAFLPIDTFTTGAAVQVAGMGAAPEDGFSGYEFPGSVGLARWGDYSSAFAAADGSIWTVAEYIPFVTTTTPPPLANWGTLLIKYLP